MCRACGQPASADDRFCEACGAPLTPGVVGRRARPTSSSTTASSVASPIVATTTAATRTPCTWRGSANVCSRSCVTACRRRPPPPTRRASPRPPARRCCATPSTTAMSTASRRCGRRSQPPSTRWCRFRGRAPAAARARRRARSSAPPGTVAASPSGRWVTAAPTGSTHDTVEQLTIDDSWVQEQVSGGRLSQDEAERHRYAHAITRWLGEDAPGGTPRVTTFVPPAPGRLLLCSDGLWNYAPTTGPHCRAGRARSPRRLRRSTWRGR